MRHLTGLTAITAVLALAACSEPTGTPISPTGVGFTHPAFLATSANATGRHVVSFNGAAPASFAATVTANGGRVDWVNSSTGLATVSGLSAAGAANVAALSGVASVDADELVALDPDILDANPESADAAVNSPSNPAGAARFARQWNMLAVHADAAWTAGRLGSSSVTIAMLDTGIDYTSLDLVGRVDFSRSVDLLGTFTVNGVSFTEADTVAKYFPGSFAFTDLFFHGTHTAATVSSNAIVTAGVTSGTTLMAVKVCAYLNTCPFSSILNGVIYAADHGADVINMSLGGGFGKSGNGRFVGLINKTFNYAKSKGVTIVVSAGNNAIDLDHDGNTYSTYCNTPAVVCVAATGPTAQASVNGPWTNVDASAFYTNFGSSSINVAAPGGNNASFVWAPCSRTSLLIPVCQTGNFIVGAQGTSMAAPHVAGAAALLVETLGRNPGLIRARLQQTADDLGAPGTDPQYGKGRLNVGRAAGAF